MKIIFFGTVKDEWELFETCVRSIQKNFLFFDWHVLVVDDGSSADESKKASALRNKNKNLTIILNKKNEGIIASLNKCIDHIKARTSKHLICIPISSDSLFINKALPYFLFWAFRLRKADFFFGKTIHLTKEKELTGITGWSDKKGIQCKKTTKTFFLNGRCRPSGWAVAFRANILKQYYYPNVGCLSDFYLNNLMILKHKSYYTSQKVVATLQREGSFSSKFSKKENKKNLLRCIKKFGSENISFAPAEVKELLKTEKL